MTRKKESPIIRLTIEQADRAIRLLGLEVHHIFRKEMTIHQAATGDWIVRWEEFKIIRSDHPVIDAIINGTQAEAKR